MAFQKVGNPYISADAVPLDESLFWETDGDVFLAFEPTVPAEGDEPLRWGQLNTALLAVNNFRRAYPSLDFSWVMFSHPGHDRICLLGRGDLRWNGTPNG